MTPNENIKALETPVLFKASGIITSNWNNLSHKPVLEFKYGIRTLMTMNRSKESWSRVSMVDSWTIVLPSGIL